MMKLISGLVCFILIPVFYCSLTGCENHQLKSNPKGIVKRIYDSGKYIVKVQYDKNGKISKKQFFNKDTIADGASINYDEGKLSTWYWYTKPDTIPICLVNYNYDGTLDTFIGNPFVNNAYFNGKYIFIQIVNPPGINMFAILSDRKKDLQYIYHPETTDIKRWIGIGDLSKTITTEEDSNRYLLYCYIVDSARQQEIRIPKAMKLSKGGYTFVKIEPKIFPFQTKAK